MSDSFFLDTNVLVYSFDDTAPKKQARARQLIAQALDGPGMISFQVVQEFLNVALRRFAQPMNSDQARAYLDTVLVPLCRVHSHPELYRDALSISQRWGFSWFDCVIVAAARSAGCDRLYTEDLQHGQRLGDLTIVDPFRSRS